MGNPAHKKLRVNGLIPLFHGCSKLIQIQLRNPLVVLITLMPNWLILSKSNPMLMLKRSFQARDSQTSELLSLLSE